LGSALALSAQSKPSSVVLRQIRRFSGLFIGKDHPQVTAPELEGKLKMKMNVIISFSTGPAGPGASRGLLACDYFGRGSGDLFANLAGSRFT
jgi:hypothetical protein